MTQNGYRKWYENRVMLVALFFFFPPLGIYAMIKHKTRIWKKILYILPATFYTTIFAVAAITSFFSDHYRSAMYYYDKKEYTRAYDNFNKVTANDENYKDAVVKIAELKPIVDSIKKADDSKALKKSRENVADNQNTDIKAQIKRELASLNKGVRVGDGENIASLQMDVVLFGAYWKILQEGEQSDDPEVKKLANEMKAKVIALQLKVFPLIRKKYVAFAKELLWEHDIEVYATAHGRTINLTSSIFAANKNIKDAQDLLYQNMKLFRFSQAQYRWYKEDDEFTYYNINPPADAAPITFDK